MTFLILLLVSTLKLSSDSFSASSLAEDILTIKESDYPELKSKVYQNKFSSPIRQQDDAGLCYAIAAATLLENHRCKKLNLDCSSSKEIISPLGLGSILSDEKNKVIYPAGDTYDLLTKLKKNQQAAVSNECAPFEALEYNYSDISIPPQWDIEPRSKNKPTKDNGWLYIQSLYAFSIKNSAADIELKDEQDKCFSSLLKTQLPKLPTDVAEILDAFKTSLDSENFMYKSLIPKKCYEKENMISLPAYSIKSYPEVSTASIDRKILKDKIADLLRKDTPISISANSHVFILEGLKTKCNEKECKEFVLMKNSFGKEWQKAHNDGWVEFDTVVKHAENFENKSVIVWLED